ncbi:twin-arginine translocase TatA/TatE family subunit [Parerythrobacter aurantius]|uniref:twin-arginine translocase TatA/TatE family subunit n=1 Tax=Parerythrobacter aurantius TaxID=3127706 RepID=UPI0032462044
MGSFSLVHWLVVLLIVLVLFGRNRISEIMGDFGKGISSFKKGMNEADKPADAPKIEAPAAETPAETGTGDRAKS